MARQDDGSGGGPASDEYDCSDRRDPPASAIPSGRGTRGLGHRDDFAVPCRWPRYRPRALLASRVRAAEHGTAAAVLPALLVVNGAAGVAALARGAFLEREPTVRAGLAGFPLGQHD